MGAPWTYNEDYPGYNPLLWADTDQLPKSYENLFDFKKYKIYYTGNI